jgi:ribonuclease P protein component
LTKTFTYQKKDKLKSRKQTQFLFSKGSAISVGPIRLLYTLETEDAEEFSIEKSSKEKSSKGELSKGVLQAGVGAPTRHFRKAVMRNKVKRLLREGYRMERPAFMNAINIDHKRLNLFFLYTESKVLTQQEIQEKIKAVLQKLADKLK